jgi:hypothetical protein
MHPEDIMKKSLVVAIVVTMGLVMAGCSGGGSSATEKEFQKLQRQYSDHFYELMGFQTGAMTIANVFHEGDRVWGEVFSSHGDLVKRRAGEILAALDTSTAKESQEKNEKADAEPVAILTINGVDYISLATYSAPDKADIYRQIQWNPLNVANVGANIMRVGLRQDMNVLGILMENGGVLWEALDKNAEKPRLLLRQGPLAFTVDLLRVDDYYKLSKVRLFRQKSMGPLQLPSGTPSGTSPTSTSATDTSATGTSATDTSATSSAFPTMGTATPTVLPGTVVPAGTAPTSTKAPAPTMTSAPKAGGTAAPTSTLPAKSATRSAALESGGV